MNYEHVATIGGKGLAPDQFAEALRGVTIGPDGALYAVGDTSLKRFSADGKLQFNRRTRRPGYCVHISAEGMIWVGEFGQIERFSANGEGSDVWRDEHRLGLVTAIATRGEDVVIADAFARCLRRYNREGKYQSDIGNDNRLKGFLLPNQYLDFCIDAEGIIHVPNPGKLRVEHYSMEGKLLGHFGGFKGADPAGFKGCCNPTNIAITPDGLIVVTEKAGPRVKIFERGGRWRGYIGEGDFDLACKNMDVVVDAAGRVYVVDTARLHIRVYAARAEAPAVGTAQAAPEHDRGTP